MRIGIVNTELDKGGAARAMQRTVVALRSLGHEVFVLTLAEGDCEGGKVVRIQDQTPPATARQRDAAHRLFNRYYIDRNRTDGSNTLFWVPSVGFAIEEVLKSLQVDVVNIHWTSYFLSVASLERIMGLAAPTVFTLHDMAHISGGCHYAGECRLFEKNCFPCPQLKFDPLNIPRDIRASRAQLYSRERPWVIAPSHWLVKEAVGSGLFTEDHTRYISNALDCHEFSPQDRVDAREEFGIPQDARVVLFGAFDHGERRKGADLLTLAMDELSKRPEMNDGRPLVIAAFGNNIADHKRPNVTAIPLGYIAENDRLARAYSACDVIALSSRQDNQPNVMVEGMACGTPVASFAIGGMLDVIKDGVSGALAEPFKPESLADAILRVLLAGDASPAMRNAARKTAVELADPFKHAMGYLDLFETAIEERTSLGYPSMRTRRSFVPSVRVANAPAVTTIFGGKLGAAAVRLLSWL